MNLYRALGRDLVHISNKIKNTEHKGVNILKQEYKKHGNILKSIKGRGVYLAGARKVYSHRIPVKYNKPIHVRDLFGDAHHKHSKRLLTAFSKFDKKGGGINPFKALKHFVTGKTKWKPSDLLKLSTKVLNTMGDVGSVIPDPRAQKVAKALKLSAKATDMSSKLLKKVGGNIAPHESLPLSGSGISMPSQQASGVYLAGNKPGGGVELPGGQYKKKSKKCGSREQVMSGGALHTRGGLYKKDLFVDIKSGKIKSKRKSAMAKARYKSRGGIK